MRWPWEIPSRNHRRRWAGRRPGNGTGVCRFILAAFQLPAMLKTPLSRSLKSIFVHSASERIAHSRVAFTLDARELALQEALIILVVEDDQSIQIIVEEALS